MKKTKVCDEPRMQQTISRQDIVGFSNGQRGGIGEVLVGKTGLTLGDEKTKVLLITNRGNSNTFEVEKR